MTTDPVPTYDRLEPRRLFASAFGNINVSQTTGNHAEGTIVVDPTNPSRLFTASNAPGVGLLGATSTDGGATWSQRPIADDEVGTTGLAADGLAPACCDPSAAFDAFGNLFLTYARDADHGVEVVRSTDGGVTFTSVASFGGDLDQPTVTAGGGQVWVTFKRNKAVAAAGASVAALGSAVTFGPTENIPGSGAGNFGDVAIGPRGQVAVTFQQGPRIGVSVDPDGVGPAKFGQKVVATTTKVGGFDRIPAQTPRGIDAEASLVFAPSAGFGTDRLYLLYTDEQPDGSDNTDIVLRYSGDGGATWSGAMRVNSDPGLSSQFLPRMAVSPDTGDLYVAWYDTRDDAGAGSPADTNSVPNDDAELFVTRARPSPTGMLFASDAQVSQGSSNAGPADSSIDLGDYIGLAYHGGTLYPLWADNSNTTGDNPDGARGTFDQYTARVPVDSLPAPDRAALATVAPQFQFLYTPGRAINLGGRPDYRFRVSYSAPVALDPASFDDNDILVTGPAGFSAGATLLSVRRARKGGAFVATYSVPAPGGRWSRDQNGTYAIAVRPGQIVGLNGGSYAGGETGWFAVRTSLSPR